MAISVAGIVSLSWLTGPIFDKELRVSSRRKRNYVLRVLYLVAMTLLMGIVWAQTMGEAGQYGLAYGIQRMADAGKTIALWLVGFQFLATQLVAVILPSTSISEEIYRKTLPALMTTPISSLQIVLGKLMSKLWQLIVLMALSLPMLAIIRVFGGVPWAYVVAALCVNFTAILFTASVSMFFSIGTRRSYMVILWTLLTGLILFFAFPWLVAMMMSSASVVNGGKEDALVLILYTNPFAAMGYTATLLISPGGLGRAGLGFTWWGHCLVMLGASAAVLTWVVLRVRTVSLRLAGGEDRPADRTTRPATSTAPPAVPPPVAVPTATGPEAALAALATAVAASPPPLPAGRPGVRSPGRAVRRVKGPPMLWKELRTPLLGRNPTRSVVWLTLALVTALIAYAAVGERLTRDDPHMTFVTIFLVIAIVSTAVRAGACITSEKESRSWPILLATPISNREIAWGKFLGLARTCLPSWIPLLAHVLVFTVAGVLHPAVLLHMLMVAGWTFSFLAATGIYFSARLRRTTAAVLANLGAALGLWAILPLLLAGLMSLSRTYDDDPVEALLCTNPVVQAIVVTRGAVDEMYNSYYYEYDEYETRRLDRRLNYRWPMTGANTFAETTALLWGLSAAGALAAILIVMRTSTHFRRNIW